jgi:hypothetical protein
MKWKKPKYGDKRTVKKFAWLPVECDNDTTCVWFEYYDEEQVFHVDYHSDRESWCMNRRLSRRKK